MRLNWHLQIHVQDKKEAGTTFSSFTRSPSQFSSIFSITRHYQPDRPSIDKGPVVRSTRLPSRSYSPACQTSKCNLNCSGIFKSSSSCLPPFLALVRPLATNLDYSMTSPAAAMTDPTKLEKKPVKFSNLLCKSAGCILGLV
jgi:hypothetical protein